MKTTTVAEFQDMIIDPPTESIGPEPSTDPFVGMRIEVDPLDAWGFVQGQIRAWLDERGIIAQEDEIRAKTNDLWGQAQSTATNGSTASANETAPYSHGNGERVSTGTNGNSAAGSHAQDAMITSGELPGMPEKPAPKMVMRVPSDAEFGADGEEFFISSPLRARADVLIERHPDLFEHLAKLSVTYLWRRKGGKSRGVPSLGKTIKPTGLLKMFSESQFAIVLAADNCRAYGYQDREIEALLFHHMLRTGVADVDEETGRGGGPTLVAPDVELFGAEVEFYGLWHAQLRAVAPAFKQAKLWEPATTYPEPITIDNPLSGAGQLIHSDGTPLTDQEIADLELAESEDL